MSAGAAAAHALVFAGLAAVAATAVILALIARMLPPQSRRPLWVIAMGLAGIGVTLLILLIIAQPRYEVAINEEIINPVAPTPESVVVGEALYRAQCQVCHGVSGGGNGPGAEGLNPRVSDFRLHLLARHSDARFFHWISEGIPGTAMPAFKDRLTVEERWHVINFMRHTFTPAEK